MGGTPRIGPGTSAPTTSVPALPSSAAVASTTVAVVGGTMPLGKHFS